MPESDAEVAVAAAEAGARLVRGRFGGHLVRHPKAGTDFATDVDLAAEAAVCEVVRLARPQDAMLGEEGGRSGAHGSGRLWLIDPLCGTLNFAAGTPGFGVNVALHGPTGLLAAAVADPLADEILWTDGASGYCRRDGVDEPLAPSSLSGLVDLNLDPPFPSAPRFRCLDLIADPGFAARFGPRVLSSSLALAWVASGKRAAYVTDGEGRQSVHSAAPIAVCLAAGCVVTDLAGQSWPGAAPGLVAAADQETHTALLDLIVGSSTRR